MLIPESNNRVASGPKISDDHLLAAVCCLGFRADLGALQRAVSVRMDQDFRLEYIACRVQRLRDAGFLRFVPARIGDELYVRLTALGVERLQSLQREPVKPATE